LRWFDPEPNSQNALGFRPHQIKHKGDSCKNNENEKEDFCNFHRSRCYTTEAEQSGNQRDYKKYDSVMQHDQLLEWLNG